jgi:hypothetical protein
MKTSFHSFWLVWDNIETLQYRKYDHVSNRHTMILPERSFAFPSSFHIYGNKVSFYWLCDNELVGFIIEDPLIASTQLSIFKLGWEFAKTFPINKEYRNINI